ncbi:hypothetical protein DFH08DRAFT_803913 [Mycena albidolilacea]|uniref:Uncharacterized protein n=1 Tax=Mycena albidolilacea TaxID=1033008 RepID=A0AAD7AAY6_9AGAR|nr:hypothetical protein DFH08DRAFT_803913 [Mycena albidolilacea]
MFSLGTFPDPAGVVFPPIIKLLSDNRDDRNVCIVALETILALVNQGISDDVVRESVASSASPALKHSDWHIRMSGLNLLSGFLDQDSQNPVPVPSRVKFFESLSGATMSSRSLAHEISYDPTVQRFFHKPWRKQKLQYQLRHEENLIFVNNAETGGDGFQMAEITKGLNIHDFTTCSNNAPAPYLFSQLKSIGVLYWFKPV